MPRHSSPPHAPVALIPTRSAQRSQDLRFLFLGPSPSSASGRQNQAPGVGGAGSKAGGSSSKGSKKGGVGQQQAVAHTTQLTLPR